MYLKSLEISGFKSFAKKGVLEFGSPITAIVGPNGSGKSNVAEAFRFVLGEQSIKSLRGKRGEDLIFNGGASAGRLNRASVKVVFDNKNRMLNLDFDEVSIERVVHRDSANEYFINSSPTRLKDIIELLAGAHIGSSGHHIISQGEADKILNANLKERRDMIEDALGLKTYHYKREESERKLEKTLENIKNVQSLRREIAPHIRFLEKQVAGVEKTKLMRAELETLYKDYFSRESLYIQAEKARIENVKAGPEKRKKQLEEELQLTKKTLQESRGKDQKSEDLLGFESKLASIRIERDRLARDAGRIEGQISSEERIISKQKDVAVSNDSKLILLKDVEIVAESVYRKIDEADVQTDIGKLKSFLQTVKSIVYEFVMHHKVQTDSSLIRESEAEISKLKQEKENITEKIEATNEAERIIQRKYDELRIEIEKEKDKNRDAEKAVFRIMAEQNTVLAELQTVESYYEKLAIIEADFKRELAEGAGLLGRSVFDFPKFSNDMQESTSSMRTSQEEKRKALEKIKIRLEDSGGIGGAEEILKEYSEAKERDAFLAREIEDLEKSAETLTLLIKDLVEKLDTEFKQGVEKINTQFGDFFKLMFGGGTAGLAVVKEQKKRRGSTSPGLSLSGEGEDGDGESFDEQESQEEGIDITVNLPQKKIKGLMMLSGGERALTSIALLFAISQVNPPPFIILDETDAALDEANSRKYGDMISSLSKYSQLILITHNRETMSRAGVLYGVTMGAEGFSKLLSIQFDQAVAVAK